jgi:hypothetical protein
MKDRRYAILILSALLTSASYNAIAQESEAGVANTAPLPSISARLEVASSSQHSDNSAGSLYTVTGGNKVDPNTLKGWKTWRALACERCHGAKQEGLVGPSLIASLKSLTKDEFHTVIINGRIEKGMPSFGTSSAVTDSWEGLYAYLKGRSDGKIKPGRLYPIETN